jgi:hypothetical protein
VSKAEYEELRKANHGIVRIGWKANKLNCCSSRKDLHVFIPSYNILMIRDIIGIMHMVVKRPVIRRRLGSLKVIIITHLVSWVAVA